MHIATTPEYQAIALELEHLNAEFTELFTRHKAMVDNDAVVLTSLYLQTLGVLQLDLLRMQTESARLKKKIKMVQAAYNRQQMPDLAAIEYALDQELKAYYNEIEAQAAAIDHTQKVLSTLLSVEETQELKEVFRVLCKRLHPDLNPMQSEEEKDLFVKVKAAYDLQRLADLQQILLFLDGKGAKLKSAELTDDQKQAQIKLLHKRIAELKEKIAKLQESFPFNIEAFLHDEEQVRERRMELKTKITAVEEDILKSRKLLDMMLDS